MRTSSENTTKHPPALLFAAGEDRFGEHRGLGISTIAMPSQDPELWRAHDMELLGPPLALQ